MPIKPKLADFSEGRGIVPGMKWPEIKDDKTALAKIQGWIDEGKLVCQGNPKPDPWWDLLVTSTAADQNLEQKPAKLTRSEQAALRVIRQQPIGITVVLRWPYVSGQLAKRQGLPRNYHDLTGDWKQDGCKLAIGSESHRLWLAGYDSAQEGNV